MRWLRFQRCGSNERNRHYPKQREYEPRKLTMIFPIRIGKHEQDMDVCLITLCPHCQRVSPFKLREVGAAVLVFEQPVIGFGGDYRLICDSCKFQKDLD